MRLTSAEVADGNRIMRFSKNQQLPEGWYVLQLDSGHYIATDGETDSAITVHLYQCRRWAIQLAAAK